MDIATIVGIVLGIGLITGAIMMDGSITAFINPSGILVVLGGTIAATLINQKLKYVLGAFGVALNAFLDKGTTTPQLVKMIQEATKKARKDGILGLEGVKIKDPFLARGMRLAVDGVEKDFIISTMKLELSEVKSRHQRGQQIFRFMCGTAPAMGMIGTLLGLVNMLQTLDDPSSIGPAMAVALLTTFYGAVLAFLIFGPIADKLESRTKEELLRGNLAIAGVESVLDGDNRTKTNTRVNVFLPPKERTKT
jgi:chemotaxis protein MotA